MPTNRLPIALLLTTAAAAQQVAGEVLGFDGRPAARATIRMFGAGTMRGDVLTDTGGRFTFACQDAVDRAQVQVEGVSLDVPIAAAESGRVRVSFVGVPFFRLTGHVVDPGGEPAAGVDVVCRDRTGSAFATVTTDRKGAWSIRSGPEIGDLCVDPLGWRHVVPGPFDKDLGLAIDLRLHRDAFFCIRGLATDEQGAPLAGAKIQARHAQQQVAWTTARADGTFALWAGRHCDELAVRVLGADEALLPGDWRQAADVRLSLREHGFLLVVGRVVDADGAGVAGAFLYARHAADWPARTEAPLSSSGSDGWFRVHVPRVYASLVAVSDGKRGRVAWQGDGPIVIQVR